MVIIQRLVEGGRIVDLTGLDLQVGLLCAKALDLPSEQAPLLRPGLSELLAQVDAVSVALAAHPPFERQPM